MFGCFLGACDCVITLDARYFGGDLSMMSMEGYGTDAFVHASRLGNHNEPLP